MKKKHELLKYAYDNYPKGTKWQWSEYGGIITSTGIFHFNDDYILTSNGSAVFDGNKWAEIVPDKVFVMTSEDGIDLYVNDNFYVSMLSRDKWKLDTHDCSGTIKEETKFIFRNDFASATCYKQKSIYKVFSTKEAAEAWIKEQNKPQLKTLEFKSFKANVASHGIYLYPHEYGHCHLTGQDLEHVYAAYKSLQ